MAEPTHVGTGAFAAAQIVSPAPIELDVSYPVETVEANDIAVARMYIRPASGGGTPTISPPDSDGWTEKLVHNTGVASIVIAYFWKRCAGGEESSQATFTGATGDGNTSPFAGVIQVFRGCPATGDPFDGAGATSNNGSLLEHTSPTITTTVDECLILKYYTATGQSTATFGAPASPQSDSHSGASYASVLGGDVAFAGGYYDQPTAGATGTNTATLSGATPRNGHGGALALKPFTIPDYLQVDTQPVNTQEDTVMAGVEVSFRLGVDDTTDTSFTGNVTVAIGANPGSATLGGTLTQAAVAGVATFDDLEINNPETGYTLVFSATGATGATSDAFNITLEPATHLVFFVGPSETQVDAVISPPVKVRARNSENVVDSNYTANIVLAIQTNPGTGVLGGTLTVAAAAGVATFSDLTIDEVGVGYVLRATSGALTLADSASFDITAGPASPSAARAFSIRMGAPLTMRL